MRTAKGKIRLIRSIIAGIIFILLISFFYTYMKMESNYVNLVIGIAIAIIFVIRGIFEMKITKNKNNTRFSFFWSGVMALYIIIKIICLK
ncbi:MAG: hypothetical protein ACRDDL_06920 [Sarcina sp.]